MLCELSQIDFGNRPGLIPGHYCLQSNISRQNWCDETDKRDTLCPRNRVDLFIVPAVAADQYHDTPAVTALLRRAVIYYDSIEHARGLKVDVHHRVLIVVLADSSGVNISIRNAPDISQVA